MQLATEGSFSICWDKWPKCPKCPMVVRARKISMSLDDDQLKLNWDLEASLHLLFERTIWTKQGIFRIKKNLYMVSLLENLQLSSNLLFISKRKDSRTGDSRIIQMSPLPPNDQQKLKLVFPLGKLSFYLCIFVCRRIMQNTFYLSQYFLWLKPSTSSCRDSRLRKSMCCWDFGTLWWVHFCGGLALANTQISIQLLTHNPSQWGMGRKQDKKAHWPT